MPVKPPSRKKADNTGSSEAGGKDRVIRDLKDRVAVLEKELRSWQDESSSPKIAKRKKANTDLDDAGGFKGTILDALPSNIAVLDRNGVIVYVNKSWSSFARENGAAPEHRTGVGVNYLDVCRSATGPNSEETPRALEGICAVLRGDLGSFELEYPCHSPDVKRWFQMYVVPFKSDKYRGILVYHNDITKRKLAEEALRASELKFRQMAENIGEVFFIFSPDWKRTIYVSPAYEWVWGRPLKDVYRDSMDWLAGVHPDDRGLPLAVVHRNVGGDVSGTDKVEFRVVRPDGSVRWIFARTFPVRDEQGGLAGITGIAEDITERKRAEEELAQSHKELEDKVVERTSELQRMNVELESRVQERNIAEEKARVASLYNRSLIEASPDPLVTISPDGKITDVNKSTEAVTGFPREHLIGTDFSDYFTEPEKAREGYLQVFEKGSVTDYPLEIRHCDGHTTPVIYNASVYKDEGGKVIGVFAAARDITERKKAEEANSRLAAIVVSSSDAIYVKTLDGIITSWNNGAEQIYGYRAEEIVGKSVNTLVPPENIDELQGILNSIKQGKRIEHFETVRLAKDGRRKNMSISISPITDMYGHITGASTIARDITERKKAEEALRIASAYNRSLIEASLDPLVTISPDGVIMDVNRATEAVTGYPRDHLVGTDFSIYFTEPVKAKEGYLKAFKEGEVKDYPLQIRRRDGHVTPVVYNASVYRDEAGRVIGVFAAARDVSELKRAEEAVRLMNAYNRSLIETSLDPLVTISPEGKITDVNVATETATGISREALTGTDFYRYFTEPAKAREGYLKAFEKGSVKDYPLEIKNKNGRIIPVLYNASVYRDMSGKVIGVFAAARDITDRRRMEEELRKSRDELEVIVGQRTAALRETRDYLESLLNYANAPIIVWDPGFAITQFNHAFERLSGYGAGEVVGKNLRMLFPPESVDESLGKIRDTLTGMRWESVEIPILRKDGNIRIALWNSANISDEKGELMATIAQGQDITERKRAEEALSDAKGRAELYLDLMGHDINNMHQIALGYLELARELISHQDMDKAEFLDKPIEVLQRCARLIQNVRKLQKLQDGVFQTQNIDVCGLLEDVQREFSSVPHKAITLNLTGCDRCHVHANELLHDVFANLVGNAIKHTGDQADIDISLDVIDDNGNGYCRVRVDDNGPGIPDDFKAKIFNRLLKGDSKAKGMGLGLYLVKSLVDSYGGRVWVEDRVKGDHSKGARFVVLLPAIVD